MEKIRKMRGVKAKERREKGVGERKKKERIILSDYYHLYQAPYIRGRQKFQHTAKFIEQQDMQ